MTKLNQTFITIVGSTVIGATLLAGAPQADAAPRSGFRAAQYELCDAGRYYRDDIRNGYMNRKQAIEEAAMYAVDLQVENAWGPETNTALGNAAQEGMTGGNCNAYR